MSIREMMDPVYANLKGRNLMSYEVLRYSGVDLFCLADPFYPDPSVPQHVK